MHEKISGVILAGGHGSRMGGEDKGLVSIAGKALYAHNGERDHPTLALLHTSLVPQLADYLARRERKLMLFLQNVDARPVAFAGQ